MAPPTSRPRLEAPPPPEASARLLRALAAARRPLDRFLAIEASSGIVLLACAAAAMVWANSPWAPSYVALWETPLGVRLGPWSFERSLGWVVNDGLMAIFFFVVGLEIRREIYQGELSELRRAALPLAAALGGMVVPAAIYTLLAGKPPTHTGWGVPMATDIAFAVGILALLGKRVPAAMRVLLLAVAVIDDLGAIIVIALFYSDALAWAGFAVAALGIAGVIAMQRLGVRSKLAYVAPTIVAWAGVYAAGVHPTIAGVVVGMMTPVRAWLGTDGLVRTMNEHITALSEASRGRVDAHALVHTLDELDHARREAISPAEALIARLHPWVAFGIMPVFALANAGVAIDTSRLDANATTVIVAVALGLVVGKPLGVVVFSVTAVRLGWAILPTGLTTRHVGVVGVVAGVGFTMALFIAQLAFIDAALLDAAKLGVLVGSAIAGVGALVLGVVALPREVSPGAAQSADEAESSTER